MAGRGMQRAGHGTGPRRGPDAVRPPCAGRRAASHASRSRPLSGRSRAAVAAGPDGSGRSAREAASAAHKLSTALWTWDLQDSVKRAGTIAQSASAFARPWSLKTALRAAPMKHHSCKLRVAEAAALEHLLGLAVRVAADVAAHADVAGLDGTRRRCRRRSRSPSRSRSRRRGGCRTSASGSRPSCTARRRCRRGRPGRRASAARTGASAVDHDVLHEDAGVAVRALPVLAEDVAVRQARERIVAEPDRHPVADAVQAVVVVERVRIVRRALADASG